MKDTFLELTYFLVVSNSAKIESPLISPRQNLSLLAFYHPNYYVDVGSYKSLTAELKLLLEKA